MEHGCDETWFSGNGWSANAGGGFWACGGGDWSQAHAGVNGDGSTWWDSGDWGGGGEWSRSAPKSSSAYWVGSNAGGATGRPSGGYGGHTDEQTGRVHFGKTYQVLSEIFDKHASAFGEVQSFLDLGCAPGGFSCRLLESFPSAEGFGLTLPIQSGGFPMMFTHPQLHIQCCDLMGVRSSKDLKFDGSVDFASSTDAGGCVDVCMADAQDLGRRTNVGGRGRDCKGGKGEARVSAAESAADVAATTGGSVGATLGSLGIWAMTLHELLLGFELLRTGGTFIFRFGWRGGRSAQDEAWYKEATHRLFALVLTLFVDVIHFKSEFSHQADACFYVVASGFQRDPFETDGLAGKLSQAVAAVRQCNRVSQLPKCLEALTAYTTPATRAHVNEMLEKIGRLRAIGLATRQHLDGGGRDSPDAALWISPVPFSLTMQKLREILERHGKIASIKRRAHPIGVGADALVQFTQKTHATQALDAITKYQVLGPNIAAGRMSDAQPGA
eukprot:TRINITY_DN17116_c0_g1_i1.p1 TRINITY_DN17116_c0_g1~~TRINITY_DN17116_c0_g1_i1.p1  ORF type:complete len:539 (+),score=69.17 TRINITY_DN17116_c0_g1_i1:123-1619(+)